MNAKIPPYEIPPRPPAPKASGVRLSDQLTIAKIKYYEAKTAYYAKLSSFTLVSNNGQADQEASS